ncbi:Replicase polyprotein [Dissostichus eleginoides]|uniref:Replicase polyprotein n=1 Tax=Dissostichus eleginoides TaxID=100907 RepID=A0AAD9BV24_DISEL|nr:Replicase polyprotein [Dissostichus eleginoides]
MKQHQSEVERKESGEKVTHSDFYLLHGCEKKHLAVGTASIHALLTANPVRKNLPPSGRLDRRTMIILVLLLSGDIQLNPGPVWTRTQARSLAAVQEAPPGFIGGMDLPLVTPRQTNSRGAESRGGEPRIAGGMMDSSTANWTRDTDSLTNPEQRTDSMLANIASRIITGQRMTSTSRKKI